MRHVVQNQQLWGWRHSSVVGCVPSKQEAAGSSSGEDWQSINWLEHVCWSEGTPRQQQQKLALMLFWNIRDECELRWHREKEKHLQGAVKRKMSVPEQRGEWDSLYVNKKQALKIGSDVHIWQKAWRTDVREEEPWEGSKPASYWGGEESSSHSPTCHPASFQSTYDEHMFL